MTAAQLLFVELRQQQHREYPDRSETIHSVHNDGRYIGHAKIVCRYPLTRVYVRKPWATEWQSVTSVLAKHANVRRIVADALSASGF